MPLFLQSRYLIFQAVYILLLPGYVILYGISRGIVVGWIGTECRIGIIGIEAGIAIVARITIVSEEPRGECRKENPMTKSARTEKWLTKPKKRSPEAGKRLAVSDKRLMKAATKTYA